MATAMAVGSEVESACKKCGKSWHVVIAMADGQIAKVECRECGARHRHRAPAEKAAAKPKARKAPARKRASSRAAEKKLVVEADPSRPPRPFSTQDTYQAGDRIVHASFGDGVVQGVVGPRKVEVLFGEVAKTLVHARDAS